MAAAAARKLQKEVEVVLKKGHEGTEEFAELWDQMASAQGPQKERLGEELKKCINKLQRLRSQMRDWLGSNAVPTNLKDKLEEGRKQIENDMSRFKDFEREFKTKAFSSTGLAKMDELDLEEAEKQKYQEWLAQTIQALKDQLDQFEADTQLLSGKKAPSADDKSRLPKLQKAQERTRWHIKKLEQLLRAANNDAVEVSDLAVAKDSIELFVEAGEDSDFHHDEQLYDCFDLTEYEEKALPKGIELLDRADDSTISGSVALSKKAAKEKDKKKKWDKKEKAEKKPPPQQPKVNKAIIEEDSLKEPDEVKVQEDQLLTEREEFICKICQIHVVGCRPKLTSCSHLFCGDCIWQWFNQHPDTQTWAQRAKAAGPDRCVPCPVCKKSLNENQDLVSVSSDTQRGENVLLWRMLSGLRIMCINNPKLRKEDGKCDWIGEYGTYQKHYEVCKNVPLADADYPPETPTPQKLPAPEKLPAPTPAPPAKQVSKATPPVAPKKSPKIAPKAMTSLPKASAPNVAAQPMAQPIATAPPAVAPVAPVAPAPQAAPTAPPVVRAEERREPPQPQMPQPQLPAPQQCPVAPQVAPVAPQVQVQPQVQPLVQRREEAPAAPAAAAPAAQASGYQGRACGNFEATGPTMVPVRQGDLIEVLETHPTGWSYAKNLSNSGTPPGWVPSWIVDASARAKETVDARTDPISKQIIVQTRDRDQDVRPTAVQPAAPAPQPVHASPAPVRAQAQLVQAARDFASGSDSQMSLSASDYVEIVERHQSGWTFGRKMVGGMSVSEGWFPDWACNP